MDITIVNQSNELKWNRYKKDFIAISDKVIETLSLSKTSSLSVIFVTPQQIHQVNREYRNIDEPTDVISFALQDQKNDYEMMEGEEELGDIFINVQAIVDQAHAYRHTLRREVCFLFAHGLLHLLGYDHMNDADEKIMFDLQDVILHDTVPKKVRA